MGSQENTRTVDFLGGVHPPHHKKRTESIPITVMPSPKMVVIPLQQHIGAPCTPCVKVKDKVLMGQKVGEAAGFVSAPVHSSVSGVVKKIEPFPNPLGGHVPSVIIENDGQDESIEEVRRSDYARCTPEDLIGFVRDAGVVGMGGAAFPTAVKLTPPPGATCDTVILNGAECEPFLTADHRIMLERTDDVITGLRILLHVLGARRGVIGIEDNKSDALKLFEERLRDDVALGVMSLKVKYPQGAELQLIKAVVDREVPPGKLPINVGVVVQNVGTAVAIAEAFERGKPLYERVVTVSGNAVAQPANLLVRVGSSFREVIEYCGGFSVPPGKVVSGGPMMGTAIKDLSVPVVKATSGILCLAETHIDTGSYEACINCARCVDVCPQFLVPSTLGNAIEVQRCGIAESMSIMDCKECGCCAYVCPAKRPLVHWFKFAKAKVLAARKHAKG